MRNLVLILKWLNKPIPFTIKYSIWSGCPDFKDFYGKWDMSSSAINKQVGDQQKSNNIFIFQMGSIMRYMHIKIQNVNHKAL